MEIFSWVGIVTVALLSVIGLIKTIDYISWRIPDLFHITGVGRLGPVKIPVTWEGVTLNKFGPTFHGGSVYKNVGIWLVWTSKEPKS